MEHSIYALLPFRLSFSSSEDGRPALVSLILFNCSLLGRSVVSLLTSIDAGNVVLSVGGLAFLGVGAGMVCGVASNVWYFNPRYLRTAYAAQAKGNKTPPEARLPMAIFGGCILPVSLFCFAWTTYPSIHWSAPIILASPFGAGMVSDAYDVRMQPASPGGMED